MKSLLPSLLSKDTPMLPDQDGEQVIIFVLDKEKVTRQ